MSASGTKVVVTQLVVDASGAKTGVADYEAALAKAKAAANDAGTANNTFDASVRKWTQSLAATDPVMKAQLAQQQALQRQMQINTQAVQLGIATQDAAAAQLDKVNAKYGAYVAAAQAANESQTLFGRGSSLLTNQVGAFIGILTVDRIISFGKSLFDNAAAWKANADQVGESTDALQAQLAVMAANGVAADTGSQLITRLTKSIGDAVATSGTARDAFNVLGISIGTLKGGAEQTLPALAAALLAIPDAAERARLEVELLGRGGQQLEAALQALQDPTAALIEQQKALGQVLGQDVVTAADAANNHLTQSWNAIRNSVTPTVVELTAKTLDLVTAMAKVATNPSGLANSNYALPGMMAQLTTPANSNTNPLSNVVVTPGASLNDGTVGLPTTQLDEYIAKQQLSASIAGQGPVVQAQQNALIDAANTKLASGAGLSAQQLQDFTNSDGTMRKFVTSTSEAVEVLGQGTAQEVQGLAATIARGNAMDKLKETFQGYLDQLNEEATAAGESATQRQVELDTIKAANIVQKENLATASELTKNYNVALGILGPIQAAEVARSVATAQTNALNKEITDQLDLSNVAMASGRDDRELALQIAQEQLKTGQALTDQQRQQLALTQQNNDAAKLKDYVDQLQDEANLAGLSADERQRQETILQAMRITHGQLTDAQKQELDGIIQTTQATQQWRSVVDGVADSFQSFFETLVEKGQANFGDLARSIEAQFVQLLAWMASQALIQPIIVPMVGEIANGLGISLPSSVSGMTGAFGSGSSSALGALGSLGSLGGLFGGSSLGGIGSTISGGIDSLGASLGFSTSVAADAGMAGIEDAGAGIGGSITSAGGLFGATTLGGLLGGAGLGSLAGSLIFGNQNSASIGSMGGAALGAAIGSIIPGIGTIIGGLLGGVAGGGLGSLTGTSNQGAITNFTNGGAGNVLFSGSGANATQSQQAAQTVSQAITTLQQAGVDVSLGNITGLNIGSSKSYVYTADGGKQKFGANDTTDVVNTILNQILGSASGTAPAAQAVIAKYQSSGQLTAANLSQLETDLGSANTFAQSLASLQTSNQQLTQIGQQIASINTQYSTMLTEAQQLGLDTTTLDEAHAEALQEVTDDFNSSITDAINGIINGPLQQWNALITSQNSQMQDAVSAQGDIGQVQELQYLQQKQLLMSLTDDQRQSLEGLIGLADNLAVQTTNLQAAALATISTQATALQTYSGSETSLAGQYGSASTSLQSSLQGLLSSGSLNSPAAAYAQSRSQLQAAAAAAQGGDLNSLNSLGGLSQTFLQNSLAVNASSSAYQQDFAYVQQLLTSAQAEANQQQTAATNAAAIAQQELTTLTNIQTELQKPDPNTDLLASMVAQLDLANTSLIGLGAGVDVTNIAAITDPINQLIQVTAAAAISAAIPVVVATDSTANAVSAATDSIAAAATAVAAASPAAPSSSLGTNIPAGVTDATIAALEQRANGPGDTGEPARDRLELWGIPGYATGLPYVPFDNYFLKAHRGEAVLTAQEANQWRASQGGANDNSALLKELQALRGEVQQLRGAATVTAQNTGKAAKHAEDTAGAVKKLNSNVKHGNMSALFAKKVAS